MCASNHPERKRLTAGKILRRLAAQDDTAMRHRAGQACWNEIANSFSQIEL